MSPGRSRRAGSADDLDLSVLRALQPRDVYTPDFVHPPPSGPLAELEDELAQMAATPADEVRAEVRDSYRGRPLPPVLAPFLTDPAAAVRDLAELIRVYWDRTLAAHWPRIRAVLEGDVLYRARQIADGGAQRLFADIDPTVRWDDDVLSIDKCSDETIVLDERGLLFVPSVFVWPTVLIITEPPWQPTIIYPARAWERCGRPRARWRPTRWPRCWAVCAPRSSSRSARRARRPTSPARSGSPRAASRSTSRSCATRGSSTVTAPVASCSTCAARRRGPPRRRFTARPAAQHA